MVRLLGGFAFLLFASPLLAQSLTPQQEIEGQVPKALAILNKWHADNPQPGDRRLHLVYWTPSDREPAPRYRERLSKIFLDVQKFYLNEMKRMGFGERTVKLHADSDGLLKIHLVKGTKPYAKYSGSSGSEIRRECLPTLKAAGINADKETVVIFCNMSNYDEKAATISQNSPYYAGGSNKGGTAWQVDSPILDLDLLDKKEPLVRDGQYGRISVGKYNSIFIGGVAHELGHALSLPHNRERPDQKAVFATALMGSGNRTYGDNLRGEGKGSFITLAHGLRLASHPIFSGSVKGMELPNNAKLSEVEIIPHGTTFEFKARVTASPPCYAVVAYMDPAGGSDYDATTCTAIPDKDGKFTLNCNALEKGKAGLLRVVALQAQGGGLGDETYSVPYNVAADGKVDLSSAISSLKLAPLAQAVSAGNKATAESELKKLEAANSPKETLEIAHVLVGTIGFKATKTPAEVEGKLCHLSEAKWATGRVGWGRPTTNRIPGETALIGAGGKIFPRGIYAHAPSTYQWDLCGKWQTFTAQAGLSEGAAGSVVFVVLADGKELFRSPTIKEGKVVPIKVSVDKVQKLELRVENAGDGNSGDHGLWLVPQLER
jgi:hypothetical protein